MLSALSDALRESFVLVEVEQLSAPEVAELLQVPLNTVYSRVRLARAGLLEQMKKGARHG
jgi:RNA polymerase sigma-70 factor (ECF subfamily)